MCLRALALVPGNLQRLDNDVDRLRPQPATPIFLRFSKKAINETKSHAFVRRGWEIATARVDRKLEVEQAKLVHILCELFVGCFPSKTMGRIRTARKLRLSLFLAAIAIALTRF